MVHVVSYIQDVGEDTYEEYKELQEKIYNLSQELAESINLREKNLRRAYFNKNKSGCSFSDRYIYVDEEFSYRVDENLLKKDLFDRRKKEVYRTAALLTQAYRENGFDFTVKGYKNYPKEQKKNVSNRSSFKDAIERYHYLISTQNLEENVEELGILKSKYSYIKDAYSVLGMAKIRGFNYNITQIKRGLMKISDEFYVTKIIRGVEEKIGYNKPVDGSRAKEILQEIYTSLGVNKKATASRLKEYANVKEHTIKRKGKSVRQVVLSKKEDSVFKKAVLKDL